MVNKRLDLFGIPFDSASMSNNEYSPHFKIDVANVPCKNQFTKLMNTLVQIAFPILMIINHQAIVHKQQPKQIRKNINPPQ